VNDSADRLDFDARLTRGALLGRLAAAGAALSLPALARPAQGAAAFLGADAAGGSLTWGLPSPITRLDIASSFTVSTVTALCQSVESLVAYDTKGRVIDNLAHFSQPSRTKYVYKLRRGVRFWDGTPLTPADVIASLNYYRSKTSQTSTYYTAVSDVKATGPNEVTVTLSTPDPFFKYVMGFSPIVKGSFVQAHPTDLGTPSVLTMGTGPYRLVNFDSGVGVDLVRNERYWGPKAHYSHISLKFITDPSTFQLAMQSGQIDGAFEIPPTGIQQWRKIGSASVVVRPGLTSAWFNFDVTQEPWSDVHVRRAFAYAFDGAGYVRSVLGGYGQVASSVVPPAMWNSLATPAQIRQIYAALPKYKFNLAKAKSELAQSSRPNGFSARIQYPSSAQEMGNAAQVLAQGVKQIGVNLDVQEVAPSAWITGLFGHTQGLSILPIAPGLPDPGNYPSLIFPSKNAIVNGLNFANYKNPTVDRLLEQQQSATKPAVRIKALAQILKIAAQDLPYLPIAWPDSAYATKKTLAYPDYSPFYYYEGWSKHVVPRT
jgi:peptide/nickel transport system substrate-binding protein